MKIFPVQLNISLTSFSIDNKKLNITVTLLSSSQQISGRNNPRYRFTLIGNWSNLMSVDIFLCWCLLEFHLFRDLIGECWTHLESQLLEFLPTTTLSLLGNCLIVWCEERWLERMLLRSQSIMQWLWSVSGESGAAPGVQQCSDCTVEITRQQLRPAVVK